MVRVRPGAVAAVIALGAGDGEPDAATPGADAARTPLETVALWIERFEAGDVVGYQALMSPDSTFACEGCGAGDFAPARYFDHPTVRVDESDARDSRMLSATHGTLGATCSADTPTVTCDIAASSLLGFEADPGSPEAASRYVQAFTVEDGLVTGYRIVGNQGNTFDFGRIAEYGSWLAEAHPADHADLFFQTTMVVNNREQSEHHRALIIEYLAGSDAAAAEDAAANGLVHVQ